MDVCVWCSRERCFPKYKLVGSEIVASATSLLRMCTCARVSMIETYRLRPPSPKRGSGACRNSREEPFSNRRRIARIFGSGAGLPGAGCRVRPPRPHQTDRETSFPTTLPTVSLQTLVVSVSIVPCTDYET